MSNDKNNNNKEQSKIMYLPIFMCIGISVGMAIGAQNRKKENDASDDQNTEDETTSDK